MGAAPDKIINVMLAGHGGSGKTTLAEALLFYTKGTDRQGTVADGNTVCDFDPEEARRLASISLSTAPVDYEGYRINLLDTPGLFDFELGMHEGIGAAESVVIVVSARSGASVGAVKAYKLAKRGGKAAMVYVSKMDSDHVDFMKAFEGLKEQFGAAVCPIIVPVVAEGKPTVYVDLIDMKAFTYSGGKAASVDVPSDPHIGELSAAMREALAEADDVLMEKFFADEEFTKEEIVEGLKIGTREGRIVPLICGAPAILEATDLALKTIKDVLPSAACVEAKVQHNGEETSLKCDPAGPLVAYVFKTVADPFVGKLSYVKVFSGKLTSDIPLTNSRTGAQERQGKLISIKGKKQTDVKEITAGDIGAISKLAEARTGDTLCGGEVYVVAPPAFPHPSMSMAIYPKKKGDEGKISSAIQRLLDEDPTLSYNINSETGQQVISGLGEQHLDVVVNKIKTKFGVEVELKAPRVAYRESIRKKVKVQGRHKKQSGGHGQFGDVWIEFEPYDGEDLLFEEKVFGGAVPKNFFPAVEKGLRDSIKRGVLAGYPVVGLKATLVDGSYHPVDSSEMAFKTAASLAYKAGLAQASPVLLEPIGLLKAYVPDSNTGDLLGEINKRRGRVLGMNPADDGLQLVEAEVPMSEVTDFTTYIRSATQGRGKFSLDFLRYDPLPAQLEAKVIEDAKELREKEEE